MRFALSHERPQPRILAAVVRVQEPHHPSDVCADRNALPVLGIGIALECADGAGDIASQGVVDDPHHPRVRWCGLDAGHDCSSTGVRRRTMVSVSHRS